MKFLRYAFALACIALLLSCGGGLSVAVNGGGVGTGGTGIVAGTLTGLGSVVVDGVRYDESQAALESRPDLVHAQSLAISDLQVGQYVYLDLDASGNPTRVRVESQLVGPAADVNVGTGQFTVWGQLVAINADPGQGPVTVLSGYQSVADVHPGDPVQVYGVLQSSDGGSDVIHATRVERLASTAALPARVTGTLQIGMGGMGSSLLLAGQPLDLSAVASAPAVGAGLAVTSVIPWTQNMSAAWQAASVALLAPGAVTSIQVSGAAHLLPGGHADVQGVNVDLSQLAADARQALREGTYVTVDAVPESDDGTKAVASAAVPIPQTGRPAQLRGSITALPGPAMLVVRGQTVDARNAQFIGGGPSDLAVGGYVDVQGRQTPDGVTATQITVTSSPPQDAVLDLSGTVQSVDAESGEIQMTTQDGASVDLVLKPGTSLPKPGQSVHAAGYWNSGKLDVRDYEADPSH